MEMQISNASIGHGAITSARIASGTICVAELPKVRMVVYARTDGSLLVSGELTMRTVLKIAAAWIKERF